MIGVADPGQAETDLAGGMLTCPSCTGPLQPWGTPGPAPCATTARASWRRGRGGPVGFQNAAHAAGQRLSAVASGSAWSPPCRRGSLSRRCR